MSLHSFIYPRVHTLSRYSIPSFTHGYICSHVIPFLHLPTSTYALMLLHSFIYPRVHTLSRYSIPSFTHGYIRSHVTPFLHLPTSTYALTLFQFLHLPTSTYALMLLHSFIYPRVHTLSFISIFNQLNAQNLFHNKFYFMPLHVSSTCSHHQEVKIALHSLWYHHTYGNFDLLMMRTCARNM